MGKNITLAIIIILGLGGLFFAGSNNSFFGRNSNATSTSNIPGFNEAIVCTTDAKQCPDGSYVGRNGPNCEFSICPVVKEGTQASIGQKMLNNGIYITPEEIVEDSRCAQDVTCIWAGQVRIRATLFGQGATSTQEQSFVITSDKPFTFNGKTIKLVTITPTNNSKITINPGDYVFTFSVK